MSSSLIIKIFLYRNKTIEEKEILISKQNFKIIKILLHEEKKKILNQLKKLKKKGIISSIKRDPKAFKVKDRKLVKSLALSRRSINQALEFFRNI